MAHKSYVNWNIVDFTIMICYCLHSLFNFLFSIAKKEKKMSLEIAFWIIFHHVIITIHFPNFKS